MNGRFPVVGESGVLFFFQEKKGDHQWQRTRPSLGFLVLKCSPRCVRVRKLWSFQR